MFRLLKDTLCKRCVFFGLNCEKKGCEHYYIFQHIIDRYGKLYAVEILSRPHYNPSNNIEEYFDTMSVDKGKRLIKHQLLNLTKNWGILNLSGYKYFLNIDRYLLVDPKVVDILTIANKELKMKGVKLVYEVTERQYETDVNIKNVFYKMLVDDIDFAADDYSFEKKTHIFVDDYQYIKIDMDIVYKSIKNDINGFTDHLYGLKYNNAKLIAEKVQSKQDFLTVYYLPFDYFQGFYFDTHNELNNCI